MTLTTRRFLLRYADGTNTKALWSQFGQELPGLITGTVVASASSSYTREYEIRDFCGPKDRLEQVPCWFEAHGVAVKEEYVI